MIEYQYRNSRNLNIGEMSTIVLNRYKYLLRYAAQPKHLALKRESMRE